MYSELAKNIFAKGFKHVTQIENHKGHEIAITSNGLWYCDTCSTKRIELLTFDDMIQVLKELGAV
jgi:hypothetical protein